MKRWDAFGIVLLTLAIAWTLVTAAGRDGTRPWPIVVLLLGTAAAYILGRMTSGRAAVGIPAVTALLTSVLLLVSPGAISGGPTGWPLGYANANAALAVQGVAAAGMAAAASPSARARVLALAVGTILTIEALLTRSAAGGALAVLVLLTAVAVCLINVRSAGRVLIASASALLLAIATTVYAGATWNAGGVPEIALGSLSERRPHLWQDALVQVQSNPVRGVGPGLFAASSELASSDPDARWAHSALLQQAAEQGVLGGLLLVLLAAWALVALARGRMPGVAAVATSGFAALGIHASVDYLLHFAGLVLVAALLVGVGSRR